MIKAPENANVIDFTSDWQSRRSRDELQEGALLLRVVSTEDLGEKAHGLRVVAVAVVRPNHFQQVAPVPALLMRATHHLLQLKRAWVQRKPPKFQL